MGSFCITLVCAVAPLLQDLDRGVKVDALVAERVSGAGPGASVLVAQDGEIVHEKAYGLARIETQEPLTTEHAFYLASVSKAFTTMAVMILVERGELSLDQSILDFFPELPEEWEGITVHHLLVHTSGLPDHFQFPDDMVGRSNEDVLALMQEHGKLDFEIGERHQYSNSGYVLAAMIVAEAAGTTYGEFLRASVFEPLGMQRTVVWDQSHPERGLLAQGYRSGTAGRPEPVEYRLYTTGAGGMFTTVGDMFRWDQALHGEELVKASTRETLFTPQVERGDAHYAYGWMVEQHRGHDLVQHGGGLPGFNTFFLRCPAERTSVVILANVSGAIPVGALAKAIFDLYVEPVATGGATEDG